MAEVPPLPIEPLPIGPPIVLPPPLSPAQERALARELEQRFRNAGDRWQATRGQLADGEVGGALRDVFVPGFISGHQWADTVLPDTRPQPGTDGIALGRMGGVPGVGYALNTNRRELSLFGQDDMGRATTPPLSMRADYDGTLRTSDGRTMGLLHDDGSFELDRRSLVAAAGALERRETPGYRGDTPRAPEERSPQAASTPPDPDWDPEEVPRQDATSPGARRDAALQLRDAMNDYRASEYQVGRWTVRLDADGMKHVMERHVPETWNGTFAGRAQTFFARGTTPADIQRMVGEVLRQNRNALLSNVARADASVVGRTAEGINVRVTVAQGRVVQVYPEPVPPRPAAPVQ